MNVPFATSGRSTVGIEWELMLVDEDSGDLVPRAPEVLAGIPEGKTRYTITGELLTNTVEVTSGVGHTVAEAVHDIADAIAAVRAVTNPLGVGLMCAGSHPFAKWFEQSVTDKTRYHRLIERTQWWGRNMMIWGIHVHIGVDDVAKVIPIVNAVTAYLPHLQGLSASSPFWAGEDTGYASNRSLVFQQLPTAGLPWQLNDWAEYEDYLEDMKRTGIMNDPTEVRWDVRPAPGWGTIELRACDGMSTLPELAAVAALVQCLVEYFSRQLDEGHDIKNLRPWFVRENKWRAARYGLDAVVIVDNEGTQRGVREHLADMIRILSPVAADLGCPRELEGVRTILATGASYQRQRAVAEANNGDLRPVVQLLLEEFRNGPTLSEHLEQLRG